MHFRTSGVVAALTSTLVLALGHGPAGAQDAPDVRQLGETAWLLTGTNGNVVIVPDARGVLLVDDERSSDLQDILTAARGLSAGPVRYAINTHWHLDHSGSNGGLAETGAAIIAHRNVRARLATDQYMAAYNSTIPASPEIALPTVVYDDTMTVHFGGESVRLLHTPAAHTDGDSLVFLEKANVLHMGDVFFNGLFPFIDRSSGGTIQGLIASVDAGIAMSNAETHVVPAHGALATRADLVAYRAMLVDVRDRVQTAMRAGQTLEDIVRSKPASAYALQGSADRFVAAIHDSLKAAGEASAAGA